MSTTRRNLRRILRAAPLLVLALLAPVAPAAEPPVVAVDVDTRPLDTPATCSDRFATHPLEHVTTVPGGSEVRQFEANGGGVAMGDLDGDGDLDLVLANHADPSSILWNEGALRFRREPLGTGDVRGVAIVDVDGDGLLDIVLTRTTTAPNLWRNQGGSFALEPLPGVSAPLYSMDWADLDGDGDLDMAGATYDAALLNALGSSFLESGQAGVYVYWNRDGIFTPEVLALNAQALALLAADIDDDGRPEILVGNDFAVPDMAFALTEEGWQPIAPFATTSHSTMSLDLGDVDNDGRLELFSTDMKPLADDPATQAAWAPIMAGMDPHPPGDPQIMANVLQLPTADGFRDRAEERGVDASGWSWSGKFGDLDNDGFLDLYVVNGMIEQRLFAHLPAHELVEENQAFRNDGAGGFRPAPAWGLGSTASGRGLSFGDLDGDGDLDVVVNNLRAPAQLFENNLCGGSGLELDLRWPGSANPYAIGAVVRLDVGTSRYRRDVRAASGYLSGDPLRLHIGIPEGSAPVRLEVTWPDGAVSQLPAPPAGALLTITRP